MRNKISLILALGAVLTLGACQKSSTSSPSTAASSESATATATTATATTTTTTTTTATTTATTATPVPAVKLTTPVLALNAEKTGLTWAAVEHASSYKVKVNDGDYAAATDYTFSTTVGAYAVKVMAIGDGTAYLNSDEAAWSYEVKNIAFTGLSQKGLTVTINGAVGLKTEVGYAADGNITTWAEQTGDTYVASDNGKVGVVVSGGYDEAHNINYVGEKITNYLWVVKDAEANRVILNNATDMADGFTSQAYGSNGWEDAGAHSVVTAALPDIQETEKSVDFKIQQLSNAYKYGFAVTGLDAYYGIQLLAKGDGKSTFVIQLENSLGYATYSVGVLNSNWHNIIVPLDAEGWKLNGTSVTLAQYAVNQGFESAAAVFYSFTTLNLVMRTVADAGYAYTHVYVNNFTLIAGDAGKTAADNQIVDIAGTYTGKNASDVIFKMVTASAMGSDVVTISSLNVASNISAEATYTVTGNTIVIKDTTGSGAGLTYTGTVTDKGRSIAFVSATGTYGSYFQQVSFNYVYDIDNFEGYTETGVGYDKNNAITARSGLRAAYFSDYYAGSGSDILSGTGWSLMGSTDYMTLDTTAADAHSGNNCMKVKEGNAMRYTTYGLSDGTAAAWPKGDTLSFWVKNPLSQTLPWALRVYETNLVNASNYSVTATSLTIAVATGWTQYTVSLDSTKTYYGFSLTCDHLASYATLYPFIDDIQVYTAGNPWATYVDPSPITAGTIMSGSTATLPSLNATFGHDYAVTVAAIDAAAGQHNMTGTYSVDSSNNITFDFGADLVYVGVLSADKTAVKYTSATGTLSAYVANMFLRQVNVGKNTVDDYEDTTEAAVQAKYVAEETDSFTTVTDKSTYMLLDTTTQDAGFASVKLKADVTSSNYNGKYRYRFAQVNSFGTVANFSIRVKNGTAYPITGGVFYVTTSNDSTKRANTNISINLAAGSGWTTFTGTITAAAAVYGFSIYFSASGSSLAASAGFVYVDNMIVA